MKEPSSTSTQPIHPNPDERITAGVRRIRSYSRTTLYICFPAGSHLRQITDTTSITFTPREWQGERLPKRRQRVVLSGLYWVANKGWRAGKAGPARNAEEA